MYIPRQVILIKIWTRQHLLILPTGNPWRMDADGPGAPSWDSAMKKG